MSFIPSAWNVIPHWTRGATLYVNSMDGDDGVSGLSPETLARMRARDEELARIAAMERRAADAEKRELFRGLPVADAVRSVRCRRIGESEDEPLVGGRYYRLGAVFIDLVCEAREHELLMAFEELGLSGAAVARMSDLVGGNVDGDFWSVDADGLGRMLQHMRVAVCWNRLAFGGSVFYDPALWLRIQTDAPLTCHYWHYYGRRPAGRPARREIRAILDAWAEAGGDQSVRVFNAFLFRHLRVSHLRFMTSEMVRPLLKAIRTTQAGRLAPPAPVKPAKAVKGSGKPRSPSRRTNSPKVVPLFREKPAPPPDFGPFDGAA